MKIKRILSSFRYKLYIKYIGYNTLIYKPLRITGGGNIKIGSHTTILKGCYLGAHSFSQLNEAELIIGNNCSIGHYNEFFAVGSIVIEDSVLTADRVYITDNLHGYEDVNIPIKRQNITKISNAVTIGEGSWIGINVCILGASIGKHCVIGSNAVVTKDIPDLSVAVGIPAKIIKRYNTITGKWEKTNPDGTFIKTYIH